MGRPSNEAPSRAYTHKHTKHTRQSTPLGGRSKEACGEYLFKGLYRPEYRGGDGGGGFHLLDQACTMRTYKLTCYQLTFFAYFGRPAHSPTHLLQYGEAGPTTAPKHGENKAAVWAHIQAVLARGGSVEGK